MGTKPCKPVVPYEEAKEKLSGPDFEHLKRVFFSVVRAPSLESTLAKDDLRAWLERTYTEAGPAVLDRLFEVLDSDGSKTLSYKEFMQGAFVFFAGTRQQRLKLVFNMFDLSGSGFIGRKEFKKIAMAFIIGNRKAQWNIPRRADDGSKVEETVDVSFFKPMTELMVDMALLEYDRDNDSKLSFEEWVKYAEEDQDVSAFVNRMEHIIPRRDGDGTAAASASDRAPTVPATRA